MIERLRVENVAEGEAVALYAVHDADTVYLVEAQTADEAGTNYTVARLRTLAERVTRDGSIGGERLG